jgi:hypothetical protein
MTAPQRPREPDKIRRRRARAWNNPSVILSPEGHKAFARLKPHLESGAAYADGRRELFDKRRQIRRRDWPDLSPSVMPGSPPADALILTFADIDARYGVAAPRPAWRDVRFRVADILKAFPPRNVAPVTAPEPPAASAPTETLSERGKDRHATLIRWYQEAHANGARNRKDQDAAVLARAERAGAQTFFEERVAARRDAKVSGTPGPKSKPRS